MLAEFRVVVSRVLSAGGHPSHRLSSPSSLPSFLSFMSPITTVHISDLLGWELKAGR